MSSLRDRYLSEFDEYDPLAEAEQYERYASDDWSARTQAGRDPLLLIEPAPRDTRQRRNGGGAGFLSTAEPDKRDGDATQGEAAGAEVHDIAQRRYEAAMLGTEDPDEDRLMPMDLEQPNEQPRTPAEKMSSNYDAPPVKPPGPDSPSTQYKDPASKFMADSGYEAKRKAYDEDWDASGKYKHFKIETTRDRAARREMQARDLYLSKQEGIAAYERSLGAAPQAPRALGVQTFRTPEGKKKVYTINSDGSYKLVMEDLDTLAEKKDKYEPGMVVTGDRWLNRMKHDSTELEPVMGNFASSDTNPFRSGAGPLAPDTQVQQRKWIEPKNDPDEVVITSAGQSINRWNPETKRYDEVGAPRAKTKAPGTGSPVDPAAALDKLARADAWKKVRNDPDYINAQNQEIKDQMFEDALKASKDSIMRSRGGGVAAGKEDELVELDY